MGYDISVFRGIERWEPDEIPQAEWDEFLAGERVRVVDRISTTTPSGEVISLRGQFLEWLGHSSGAGVPMRIDGQGPAIVARDADDETIRWLIAVAARLGGRVQGEAGEYYEQTWPGSAGPPPSPARPRLDTSPRGRWWTRRGGHAR